MIQTVLGEVKKEEIRKVLSHEHIVFKMREGENNSYASEAAYQNALRMLSLIQEHDVNLIVDATTTECGRDVQLLKRVSQTTNIHIVCSTGLFKDECDRLAFIKSMECSKERELANLFIKEIRVGISDTGIKAGVIKIASSLHEIRPFERVIFSAAARTQKLTGVPILTHCESGTMGLEQATYLLSLGVHPKRIIIGHMTSNHKLFEIEEIIHTGVYVAFDQFGIVSIPDIPTDEQKMENLLYLIRAGYEDSIVLSHDCVFDRMGYVSTSKPRYPNMIFEKVIPYLKQNGVNDMQLQKLTRMNLLAVFDNITLDSKVYVL